METKNPPPMMTEKIPTTKPPTRSSAVSLVSSQGASALIHERSITLLHPDASNGMHRPPLQRRMTREFSFSAATVISANAFSKNSLDSSITGRGFAVSSCFDSAHGLRKEPHVAFYMKVNVC